jgi:hypothetical protein
MGVNGEYEANGSRGWRGKSRRPTNVGSLVRGTLKLVFWPSLPKSEVGGQVGVLLEML